MVARVDAAAVQTRVLPGDREAKTAALGAGPRGVGLEEAVEQVRDRAGGQPVAVVAHVHGQPRTAVAVGLEASRHRHREGSMAQDVSAEVPAGLIVRLDRSRSAYI